MTNLIAFPFRLTSTGAIAVNLDGSDACTSEELAQLCLTQPGERELTPLFGLSDPTFGDFDQTELVGKVRMFLPDVSITNVQSTFGNDGEQRLMIAYESAFNESEGSFNG
jgi:hypothetical protein